MEPPAIQAAAQPSTARPTRWGVNHALARTLATLLLLWLSPASNAKAPTPAKAPPPSKGAVPRTGPAKAPFVQPASTLRMVERLAELRRELERDPTPNSFASAESAEYFRKELAAESDPQKQLSLRPKFAGHLLNAGKSEEALHEFELFQDGLAKLQLKLDSTMGSKLTIQRAVCHLRIGEQENCLANHTCESCLFPIKAGGIHQLERGSRGAIGVLSGYLRKSPDDLQARWLLNIAHMTLGEYPDKVEPASLIPPRVFESENDLKRFPDVAPAVGLDVHDLAGGSIVEDFDGDGFLDVMTSSWSLKSQLRLFHNHGDGTFTERGDAAGLTGLVSGLNMMQTDYNNDGFADVFVLRGAWLGAAGHYPNSLLRNNGDGTFTDVTEEAGLLSFHPTQTATWFDFNSDGWLDVFIGNESTPGEENPCELYRNNGDGTFTDCTVEAGVSVVQFIKGVTNGDFNHDGRPDLYLSNRSGSNILFRNDGPQEQGGSAKSKWKFTDVTAEAGVKEPLSSFPTWSWDYDNDGWQDLMVTGYSIRDVGDIAADYLGLPHTAEKPRLYHNNHDGTFTDMAPEMGLSKVVHAMGTNYGDLDNDGWLDFYAGTGDPNLSTIIPNRMFRNDGGRRFQEVTSSGGFGHLQKGHGVSFADLDNDGDQDVHVVMGGAYSGDTARHALFLNPGHGHHWITLKLEGVTSNRAAIGARIRAVVKTAEGERSIYKTVGTGASFGANPLRQQIGLGRATAIRSVEILWPVTGRTQTLTGLRMDRFYTVREDAKTAVEWKLKKFLLPSPSHHSQQVKSAEVGVAK